MAKTTEHRTVVKVEGKITRVNILDGGDAVEILYDIEDCTESQITDCTVNQDVAKAELSFEEKFPIVRASELSLEDAFLKHEPTNNKQKRLKDSLIAGINEGLKDFRCPAMDPSFDKDGNLVYEAGNQPAVGYSARFWAEKLKQFMPEKNSRMGTLREHDALLGLLIKYLIEERKYKVPAAWETVCDDSKKLGHYWNSEDAKHSFEPTGSRKVWNFYDWANTCKIIAHDCLVSKLWRTGGNSYCYSYSYSLATVEKLCEYYCLDYDNARYGSEATGWLVLDV